MSLQYNARLGEYVITTIDQDRAQSTGLTLSRSTTGPMGESVYFTKDPYAALNFMQEADAAAEHQLRDLWEDYEKSWALECSNSYEMGGGVVLRPYQNAGVDYCVARPHALIGDAPGVGKNSPLYSKLLTPNGWIKMGDVKLGDEVIGCDGLPHRVTGVYPQGVTPSYRVVFRDGTSLECGLDHLWAVGSALRKRRYKRRGGSEYTVKTLRQLIDGGLCLNRRDGRKGPKWYVPLVEPVRHPERELPVDPYVLGVLLGDGAISGARVTWSTPDMDADIVVRMRERLPNFQIVRDIYSTCPHYHIQSGHRGVRNAIKPLLESLDVRVKSTEKFIPEMYLFASVEQRLDLLRGLMDTDGCAQANRISFSSLSERLANDVAALVRSLGGTAIVHSYDRTAEGKSIEWDVNIKLAMCPFYSVRKSKEWRPTPHTLGHKYIERVEYVGDVETQCIRVDAEDHLYVADDYTVTHNTFTGIGVANATGAGRTLVVTPGRIRKQWRDNIKLASVIPKVRCLPVMKGADGIPTWAHYVVISYDLLRNPAIHAAICAQQWDLMLLDEVHFLKEMSALRTQMIFGGGRCADPIADHVSKIVGMTGTPLPNRPRECYTVTRALCWDAIDFMSFDGFRYRFNPSARMQGTRDDGTVYTYTKEEKGRLPELHARLRCNFMVRRLKSQVLPWLPDKTYEFAYIESDGRIADIIQRERMLDFNIEDLKKPFNAFDGELSTLRREMGEAKVPQALQHVGYLLDIEEVPKIVIFAHHRSVMDALAEGLKDYGVVQLRGGMSAAQGDNSKRIFVSRPEVRIFIAQTDAAGVGLDGLQHVASHCVIVEPAWTPGGNEQAIDRLHRDGQHANVIAQFLVAEGSLDERILASVLDKTHTIHAALDDRKRREI